MTKKIAAVVCLFTMFCASPALSYQREARSNQDTQEEARPEPIPEERNRGYGLMIAGYTMIGLGGAAAIAGSAIATASSSRRLTGVIVGSSGAAIGLAGSLMLLFSSHEKYSITPQIDPIKNQYGLAFAANF